MTTPKDEPIVKGDNYPHLELEYQSSIRKMQQNFYNKGQHDLVAAMRQDKPLWSPYWDGYADRLKEMEKDGYVSDAECRKLIQISKDGEKLSHGITMPHYRRRSPSERPEPNKLIIVGHTIGRGISIGEYSKSTDGYEVVWDLKEDYPEFEWIFVKWWSYAYVSEATKNKI